MGLNSDLKLLEYLARFSKEQLNIELNSKTYEFPKIDTFVLRPTFWDEDGCNLCGLCCSNFGMAYFISERQKLESSKLESSHILIDRLQVNEFKLNGKKFELLSHHKVKDSDAFLREYQGKSKLCCPYVFELDKDNGKFGCSIHDIRSYTCKFPHLRLYGSVKDPSTMYMGTRQYGRNWALGCTVKFKPSTKNAIDSKLQLLKDFERDTRYLGIKLWVKDIVEYIENNYDKLIKYVPMDDVVFNEKFKKQKKINFD